MLAREPRARPPSMPAPRASRRAAPRQTAPAPTTTATAACGRQQLVQQLAPGGGPRASTAASASTVIVIVQSRSGSAPARTSLGERLQHRARLVEATHRRTAAITSASRQIGRSGLTRPSSACRPLELARSCSCSRRDRHQLPAEVLAGGEASCRIPIDNASCASRSASASRPSISASIARQTVACQLNSGWRSRSRAGLERLDLGVDADPVAALEQIDDQPRVAGQHQLLVAGAAAAAQHLGRVRQPPLEVRRAPARAPAGRRSQADRLRVVELRRPARSPRG